MSRSSRALRVAGSAFVGSLIFLEGGCSSGGAPRAATSAEATASYEAARLKAWNPGRRFKALFRAEVSPKVGAVGRGYLSVWWDGASGELAWRTSAPIAGAGRGGILRLKEGGGGASAGGTTLPLSARLAAPDLVACILGTPDAPASADVTLDDAGRVVSMRFPRGQVVKLQPGEGVPRRIEANGPDGRAILTLESYAPWPKSEEIPPL